MPIEANNFVARGCVPQPRRFVSYLGDLSVADQNYLIVRQERCRRYRLRVSFEPLISLRWYVPEASRVVAAAGHAILPSGENATDTTG